jgi:hypothetical protein
LNNSFQVKKILLKQIRKAVDLFEKIITGKPVVRFCPLSPGKVRFLRALSPGWYFPAAQ